MRPSELSKCNSTCAMPKRDKASDPPKITSAPCLVRRVFELCSPSTQRIASEIFDFPEPFGPTIAVKFFVKLKVVLSANDLNPCRVRVFKRMCVIIPEYEKKAILLLFADPACVEASIQ